MGLFYFPANFVYWEKVKDHDKIKDRLLDEINKRESCDSVHKKDVLLTKSSSDYHSRTNDIANCFTETDIKNIIWEPLDHVLEEMNSRKHATKIVANESYITASWYTRYESNGSMKLHTHSSGSYIRDGKMYTPTFSMIYILNNENECNSTIFVETASENRISIMGPAYANNGNMEHQFHTKDVKEISEGTILIFPSSLYHMVDITPIPGRITIAINIASC
jgi:hypothetical protein